jgi:GNAT superfamily N-acetyltransferase
VCPTLSFFFKEKMHTLKLVVANQNQMIRAWTNSHPVWSRGLSMKQYIAREQLLAAQAFAGENLTVYALVDPQQPDMLLSHCDVFLRPGYMSQSGHISEIRVASIASVFTPEQHRKHGYATRMMELVRDELEKQQVRASNLYSDVGRVFYDRLGWTCHASMTLKGDVVATSVPENVEWITDDLLERVVDADIRTLQEELRRGEQDDVAVLVVPEVHAYRWMFTRHDFYAEAFLHAPATVRGAQLHASNAFMMWTHDVTASTTRILRARFASVEEAVALLGCCLHAAHEYGMKHVYTFVSEEQQATLSKALEQFPTLSLSERTDSLSSLMVLASPNKAVHWLCNEAICWV